MHQTLNGNIPECKTNTEVSERYCMASASASASQYTAMIFTNLEKFLTRLHDSLNGEVG